MILIETITLCVLSFALGVAVMDIMNTNLEKAFYENLRELKEIHNEIYEERENNGGR